MKKCVYLVAPNAQRLSDDDINDRVQLLVSMGISIDNIKIHPNCQPDAPDDLKARRAAKWEFKILGAFVGTDEFVMNAIRQKSKTLKDLTDVMLPYPNVQARYHLHKCCYNLQCKS